MLEVTDPNDLRSDIHACGDDKVRHLAGRPAVDADKAQVARLSGAKTIRWLTPGMPVTEDYSPTRLNVEIDGQGMLVSFHCG